MELSRAEPQAQKKPPAGGFLQPPQQGAEKHKLSRRFWQYLCIKEDMSRREQARLDHSCKVELRIKITLREESRGDIYFKPISPTVEQSQKPNGRVGGGGGAAAVGKTYQEVESAGHAGPAGSEEGLSKSPNPGPGWNSPRQA